MSAHRNEIDSKAFVFPSVAFPLKSHIGMDPNKKKGVKIAKAVDEKCFVERRHLSLDFFEYNRDGSDPGKVLIFNQELFDGNAMRFRRGSRRDVNEIIVCLQRLGYNIHEDDVCTDFTLNDIMKKLDEVLKNKEYLSKTNCLIVFFLTHGESSEELHAKDTTLKTNEIWGKLQDCEELKDKPKMFIFQACKGDGYSTTEGENSPYNPIPSKIINISNFSANQLGPDMLLVYATIEGNVSFRNPLTGSWFIQELCKNFSAYGRRDDVISMLIRTTKCVCGNYYNQDDDVSPDIQKQMPVFVSTLSKKFYLNRNKDRNILLDIQRQTQEIHDMVTEIAQSIRTENLTRKH